MPYQEFTIKPPTDREWLRRDIKAEHEAEQLWLRLLADLATKALADEGLGGLGSISVVPARPGRHSNQAGQLRSQPLEDLGGVEFRFDVLRGDVLYETDAHVTALVSCARKFAEEKPRKLMAAEKLLALTGELSSVPSHKAVRLVGLGISNPGDRLHFHVTLERLGVDLKHGIEQLCAADLGCLDSLLRPVPREQENRLAAARNLRAINADGWIDQIALRIIDTSALPRAKAFDLLGHFDTLSFSLEGPAGRRLIAFLFWRNGVVMAELQGDGWYWSCNCLELQKQTLPQSVLHSLVGQPLRTLVELPVMPLDAPITRVEQSCGTLLIRFGTLRRPFNIATAEVREIG